MAELKKYFVVSLELKGIKYYFHHEEVGTVNALTGEITKEARGYFCNNLKRAVKWTTPEPALMFASSFDGTQVETIYSEVGGVLI